MRKLILLTALALLGVLCAASAAPAKSRDRNHDRLPDRWEQAHHLSLKVSQARRDQDRDGLNNRGEFRAKTDPRDSDTDNDGIDDGSEHAGTVASFNSATGILTIALAGGGELAAKVDDATEIECHHSASASSEGSDSSGDDPAGHDAGDDQGDDPAGHDAGDDHGDDPAGHDAGDDHGDDPAGHDAGDDHGDDPAGDDNEDNCGTEALTTGTQVREAELKTTGTDSRWTELKLTK